jgi:hypothetical protein
VNKQHQTDQQRSTRNVAELLQELRVAQAGVQILFGFLLAVTFTEAYLRASGFQHAIHLATVFLAVAAMALLTAPAAWHRILFRRGQREQILRVANKFAMLGLTCLAGAVTGTVLLITDVVIGGWFAIMVATATAIAFSLLWFVLPLRHR